MTQGIPELSQVQVRVPNDVLAKLEADKVCHHRLGHWRPEAVAITENFLGEILIAKSTKSKHWGFPQGGIERYESNIQGLVRELYQETGVVAAEVVNFCLLDMRDIANWERDGFTKGKRYYYFHVRCKGVPEVTLELDELCEYQWLAPQRARDFIASIEEKAYREKRNSMLLALGNAFEY